MENTFQIMVSHKIHNNKTWEWPILQHFLFQVLDLFEPNPYVTDSCQIATVLANHYQNRSFSLSRNKKNKLKTIQWKKLQNWDVIEDKKIRHFSKF